MSRDDNTDNKPAFNYNATTRQKEIIRADDGYRYRVMSRLKINGEEAVWLQRLCKGLTDTCERNARKTRDFCNRHGGKAKRGVESNLFKHGRYAQTFQGSMLERYEKYLTVGQNRENLEAMAVLQLMIDDDAEKLQDNALLWREAKAAFRDLQDSMSMKLEENATDEERRDFLRVQQNRIKVAINSLQISLNNGGEDAEARVELRKNMDLQTKIRERDTRSRVLKKHMVTLEEILTMLARNKAIIEKYVPQEQRNEFDVEYEELMKKRKSNVYNFKAKQSA